MASLVRLLPLVLVASVAFGGCGQTTKDTSGDFRGEQRAVAQAVEDFQDAGKKGDAGKICDQLLTPGLVKTIQRANGKCADVLDDDLQDVDSFELEVQKVTIAANKATVLVKSKASDGDRTDTFQLERSGRNWKIASLGG